MDLMEKLQVFSEKLGRQTTVCVNGGAMLCTEGAPALQSSNSMWMKDYWGNTGEWYHHAWENRW